ncbi:MAG: hypothetical protein ACRYG2_14745, partial [Janthinobacterium lividum]
LAELKLGSYRSARLHGLTGEGIDQTDHVITNGAVARLAATGLDPAPRVSATVHRRISGASDLGEAL